MFSSIPNAMMRKVRRGHRPKKPPLLRRSKSVTEYNVNTNTDAHKKLTPTNEKSKAPREHFSELCVSPRPIPFFVSSLYDRHNIQVFICHSTSGHEFKLPIELRLPHLFPNPPPYCNMESLHDYYKKDIYSPSIYEMQNSDKVLRDGGKLNIQYWTATKIYQTLHKHKIYSVNDPPRVSTLLFFNHFKYRKSPETASLTDSHVIYYGAIWYVNTRSLSPTV